MDSVEIKKIIKAIGFKAVNGKSDVYQKHYSFPSHQPYDIDIDFNDGSIIYPKPLKVSSKTTSNFKNPENFVVLECVDRLLRQGYTPNCIKLERKFPLGHKKNAGLLDINVTRPGGKSYLMIECKTAGVEFEKELKNMPKDEYGGQLFTYYQQDTNTEFLCL